MARYIKANKLVAEFLQLQRDRNTVKDGNYLLWQNDMLAFGPLTQLPDTLKQIGGIALMASEAREEQDGTVTRPLPVAEDPRFVIVEDNTISAAQAAENAAGDEVAEDEEETPAEATEEATEEATGEAEETTEAAETTEEEQTAGESEETTGEAAETTEEEQTAGESEETTGEGEQNNNE